MADFSSLKQTIQTYIKQNGNEEITGNILQDVLLAMVSTMGDGAINSLALALQDETTARQNQDGALQGNITAEATARQQADTALGGRIDGLQSTVQSISTMLGKGYLYAGIATTSTNPGSPTGKVFYIATDEGTYTNFLDSGSSALVLTRGINIIKFNGTAWANEQLIAINNQPTDGSHSLVDSGGVYSFTKDFVDNILNDYCEPLAWVENACISRTGLPMTGVTQRCYSSKILAIPNATVYYKAETSSSNVSGLTFYDKNDNVLLTCVNLGADDIEKSVVTPIGSAYMRISVNEANISRKDCYARLADSKIKGVYSSLYNELHKNDVDVSSVGFVGETYINSSGNEAHETESLCTGFVAVESGRRAMIYNAWTKGVRCICAYDDNQDFITDLTPSHQNDVTEFELAIPNNAAYIRITGKMSEARPRMMYLEKEKSKEITLNPSSGISVQDAIEAGYDVIHLSPGKYFQSIDMTSAKGRKIIITSGNPTYRPSFYYPDCIISESSEAVSGYTKVKKCNFNGSFLDFMIWIFQDNAPDTTTLITDAERHPLQVGKTYRCEDTPIQKCTQTTLSGALDEIEGYEGYKWFFDSANHVLYFSSPLAVSSNNPLCYSNGTTMFYNVDRTMTIELYGIECKYMMIDFSYFTSPKAVDCHACNTLGNGAFCYSFAINATFIRCEAERCNVGTSGDGFNADGYNSGDARAKCYTGTLIDCWSHDNTDDGWSEHRKSQTTIIGGLFEYNGKAGVTPSYGNHCACYNVYSRKNFAGFFYCGTVQEAEQGKYGQLICFGCVAENNTLGGQNAGFVVDGEKNKLILVECKAIGNTIGYKALRSDNEVVLIDCGSLNNTTVRDTTGHYTIQNTQKVE